MPTKQLDAHTVLTELNKAQRAVSRGELASEDRKRLMWTLWSRGGMTYAEIAEVLSATARATGAEPITENAVTKMLIRYRRENDLP